MLLSRGTGAFALTCRLLARAKGAGTPHAKQPKTRATSVTTAKRNKPPSRKGSSSPTRTRQQSLASQALAVKPPEMPRGRVSKVTERQVPKTVVNEVTMHSSITNAPFSPQGQKTLRAAAAAHQYRSKYWLTLPQSLRSCNARVLPGEKPTTIYLHVEKVVPVAKLSKQVQKRVLDEHPPFFGSGVGILSERRKWRVVNAERLVRFLNRAEEDRALFIDVALTKELGIKFNPRDVIDIRPASYVHVFNGDQLDDPFKAEPQRGLALNAITGKRLGQPAHDILLAVGLMRGYTSPMWIFEKQIAYLNLKLRPSAVGQGVLAPDMRGLIVPLSRLPAGLQRQLLAELRERHPQAEQSSSFFIYNINRWETSRSRVLVRQMAHINDQKYPYFFVNVSELAIVRPECLPLTQRLLQSRRPLLWHRNLSSHSFDTVQSPALRARSHPGPPVPARRTSKDGAGPSPTPDNDDNSIVVQSRTFFFAEDATLRRYYNAMCLTQPHLAMPSVRPIAIVNGRLLGRRDESVLRAFSLRHKLASPLWLTAAHATRLGVTIPSKNRNKFALIGAEAADGNPDVENSEGFYNLDDFPNPDEILSLFPKASRSVHFMLDSKWRPVLGKQRQEFLASLKRTTPLWVSVNECLMSGFRPMEGREVLVFPGKAGAGAGGGGAGDAGRRLYNSLYTSDPVRCIGLSTMLARTATPL